MNNCLQLEFGFEKSETDKLKDEIKLTFTRVENVRKGVFKKHTLLAKDITELKAEIDLLKQQIELVKNYLVIPELANACG
jgi:uncharacterized protein YktB (UPF0637 family)